MRLKGIQTIHDAWWLIQLQWPLTLSTVAQTKHGQDCLCLVITTVKIPNAAWLARSQVREKLKKREVKRMGSEFHILKHL